MQEIWFWNFKGGKYFAESYVTTLNYKWKARVDNDAGYIYLTKGMVIREKSLTQTVCVKFVTKHLVLSLWEAAMWNMYK